MQKDVKTGNLIAEVPHTAEGAEAPANRDPLPKNRRREQTVSEVRFWQDRGELWRLVR